MRKVVLDTNPNYDIQATLMVGYFDHRFQKREFMDTHIPPKLLMRIVRYGLHFKALNEDDIARSIESNAVYNNRSAEFSQKKTRHVVIGIQ